MSAFSRGTLTLRSIQPVESSDEKQKTPAFANRARWARRASSSLTALSVILDAMTGTIIAMPLTVFDTKGVPGTRREHIEATVVAGGRQALGPHEAWIAAERFKGGFRVLITGPQGFEMAYAGNRWVYSPVLRFFRACMKGEDRRFVNGSGATPSSRV